MITDPPYNVNYGARGKQYQERDGYQCGMDDRTILNDNMSSDAFNAFLSSVFLCASQVLAKGAAFYVWFASREHTNFEDALIKNGFEVKQELIWNKSSFTLGRQDYQWKHEPCLYGWKADAAHFFIADRTKTTVIDDTEEDIDSLTKDELREKLKAICEQLKPFDVLEYPKPVASKLHPTMKPVELIGEQMANSSRKGDSVLDLFGGSGTTLIAAEQLGRKAYLMELDPAYVDVIIDRWEKHTGQVAELVEE